MMIILPTNVPFISTYPHHASLFSVLNNDNRSLNWIFHNYLLPFIHLGENKGYGIDLCSYENPWYHLKWLTCPMINVFMYKKSIILKKINIDDFLYSLIDDNNYIYTFAKTNYRDIVHEIFISGYNLSSKEILVHDFYSNTYSKKWIKVSDIDFNLEDEYLKEHDYLKAIWGIEKNNDYLEANEWTQELVFNFNKQDLLKILREYIGENQYLQNRLNKVKRYLGLSIYDKLVEFFDQLKKELLTKKNIKNFYLSSHSYLILYEHKKLLLLAYRTVFNIEFDEIVLDLTKIIDKALLLHYLIIYINETKNIGKVIVKIDLIIDLLKSIKSDEFCVFSEIIKLG